MKISKKQIAKWQEQEAKKSAGRAANNLEQDGWVRDRKTGEWYDPKTKFEELCNSREFLDEAWKL